MTLYNFKLLTEHEQAEAVWEHGVHIGTRYLLFQTVALYQLEGFYAEVFYCQNENRILKIRSFLSTHCLEPYLRQIDVSQLLQQ